MHHRILLLTIALLACGDDDAPDASPDESSVSLRVLVAQSHRRATTVPVRVELHRWPELACVLLEASPGAIDVPFGERTCVSDACVDSGVDAASADGGVTPLARGCLSGGGVLLARYEQASPDTFTVFATAFSGAACDGEIIATTAVVIEQPPMDAATGADAATDTQADAATSDAGIDAQVDGNVDGQVDAGLDANRGDAAGDADAGESTDAGDASTRDAGDSR